MAVCRWRFFLSIFMALIVLLSIDHRADAHAYSATYSTLEFYKSKTELTYALDDLSVIELVGGDTNHDGTLDSEEFAAVDQKLLTVLQNNLVVKINGEAAAWPQLESFGMYRKRAIMKISFPAVAASQSIQLTDQLYLNDTASNYVNLMTIYYGAQKSTAALSGNNRTWTQQMTENDFAGLQSGDTSPQSQKPEEEASSSKMNGWFSFFVLGMNHILSGYDHLLFLFSLLIARQTFKQYAGTITAFTIAHSITLALTVTGVIHISSRIVEPAIALSICYVALDNLIRKKISYRWVLTFFFGMIHGMGFADILTEMNIPKSELAVDLISFNVGIETVQVIIVALVLPALALLYRWKHSRHVAVACSALALVLGGLWLVERVISNV
ncbi:HupE/UreJ family protein [Paenibacillus chondroitinus]|uniref:HupE/UreJ family protein n=1 Tax=Paenibacillus chondroitinus TaxID=59842 RepID=A0ABU6DHZ8_9BACL|nr:MULTISPECIES: HupE/UreJ family protein [Paenibacillus]MCY9657633.1 HupE/UreJ family protein [Paenibacillus anseongense]MEB4797368.1 HupE/UreJ family protein [Paenibacillus chondroitinus]